MANFFVTLVVFLVEKFVDLEGVLRTINQMQESWWEILCKCEDLCFFKGKFGIFFNSFTIFE